MMRSHVCILSFLLFPLPSLQIAIGPWIHSVDSPDANEVASPMDPGPSNSQENMLIMCNQKSDCPQGFFCDRHFGLCLNLRQEGDYCRWDANCARDLHCMFGKCRKTVPSGKEGARCFQDSDCGPNTCCARLHGEMVCKRRLGLDEECHIPQGGLDFSLNQVCPCQEGLVCRRTSVNKEKPFEYWPGNRNWKCQTY